MILVQRSRRSNFYGAANDDGVVISIGAGGGGGGIIKVTRVSGCCAPGVRELGDVPSYLDETDARPAAEQFSERWRPIDELWRLRRVGARWRRPGTRAARRHPSSQRACDVVRGQPAASRSCSRIGRSKLARSYLRLAGSNWPTIPRGARRRQRKLRNKGGRR